jgi:uncharacterized protein (TIGR02246 family)
MMEKSVFSKCFALLLFSALALLVSVGVRQAAAKGKGLDTPAPSNDPAAVEAIKQLGRDLGDAMVDGDIDKVNQIYADDWAVVGRSGTLVTKDRILQNMKAGKNKLVSYVLGPMDVQVFGDVAVVHGGVSEKRVTDGKEDSSESVYMDLLKKRAGKWVIVRSGWAEVE